MKRMYVLVNEDLKMSRGKVAAQVAHAVARLYVKYPQIDDEPQTVIILGASTNQLIALNTYCGANDIRNYIYVDEGVNEIPSYSFTAMAIEPLDEHYTEWGYSTDVDLSGFKLLGNLKDKKKGLFR